MALTLDGPDPSVPVDLRDRVATVRLEPARPLAELPLAALLDELAARHPLAIDVDVSALPELDAPTAELLADVHTRLCGRGGRLRVVGANDRVAGLLARRGLRGLLRA